MKISIIALLLASFLVVSCGPIAPSSNDALAPQSSEKVFTDYKKIFANADSKPDWTDISPDDDDTFHYVVGLSTHFTQERDAWDGAMRHARGLYAKYTGVDISIAEHFLKTTYGKSSGILDATIEGTVDKSESVDAKVSRVSAKQKYVEKYHLIRNGQPQGIAWKCWVLVRVPLNETAKVQAFAVAHAAQIAAEANQQEKKRALSADAHLQAINSRMYTSLAEINSNVAAGLIIPAFQLGRTEWNNLSSKVAEFKAGDTYHQEKVVQLEVLQATLRSTLHTIRSTIEIDVGRFESQVVRMGQGSNKISVWVWSRSDQGYNAVAGAPVQLNNIAGEVLARATSSSSGRADFLVGSLAPGHYRVKIDSNAGPLARFDEKFGDNNPYGQTLVLREIKADMEGAANTAVLAMFSGPRNQPLRVSKITMGPVTYSNSQMGTPFGFALQAMLRQQMTSISGLTVISPKTRSATKVTKFMNELPIQHVWKRSIDMQLKDGLAVQQGPSTDSIGLVRKEMVRPSLALPAIQAAYDNAEAVLEVSYTIHEQEVWLELNMQKALTNQTLVTELVKLDRSMIPTSLHIFPPPAPRKQRAVAFDIPIQLDVSSTRGAGQTYKGGEVISFFVSSDQDAYLLLIYEDVEHNLIQILPNHHSGDGFFPKGEYIEVPGRDAIFDFTIKPPYGVESLRVFAASSPFPSIPGGRQLSNGLILHSKNMSEITQRLRQHGDSPRIMYGEADTILTTVAGR